MKKVKFNDHAHGKGFAAALVLSLCAVGISTYAAYTGAVSKISTQKKTETNYNDEVFVFTTPETAEANAEKFDIPKETDSEPLLIIETKDDVQVGGELTDIEKSSESGEEAGLFFKSPKTMPIADAQVINPYSKGELVKSETLGVWKTHDGVDLAAAEGTAVSSMMKGKVTEVKKDPLWGICVIIDHGDGVVGHYCGLSENVNVKAGQEVLMGEIIGSVGMTADVECKLEPHLHFGVTVNGAWTDPIEYINS